MKWIVHCEPKAVSKWSAVLTVGCLLVFATPIAAQTSDGFETMAQSEESTQTCDAPRPPRDLHSFAYVRNGYREILRIIAVEHAIKAQFCGCQFDLVGWEDAIFAIDRFQTSDNPRLPFDVIALRGQADAAENTLEGVCAK